MPESSASIDPRQNAANQTPGNNLFFPPLCEGRSPSIQTYILYRTGRGVQALRQRFYFISPGTRRPVQSCRTGNERNVFV